MTWIALACCLSDFSDFIHKLIVFLEGTFFNPSWSATNWASWISDFFLLHSFLNSSSICTLSIIEKAMISRNDQVRKLWHTVTNPILLHTLFSISWQNVTKFQNVTKISICKIMRFEQFMCQFWQIIKVSLILYRYICL